MKSSHDCPAPASAQPASRLMDQVHGRIRRFGLALRTEGAYCSWIRRFILYHGKRHPRELGALEVEQFLTDLAVRHRVAASTQNQALAALLFLYHEMLAIDLPWMSDIQRAKRPVRVPLVLSMDEVARVLDQIPSPHWLSVPCSMARGCA